MAKLQDIQKQQEEQHRQEAFWNNQRLAEEHIVFCMRRIDLVSNPFGKNGEVQWEATSAFVYKGKKTTARHWFSSTQHDQALAPTRWDELFRQNPDLPVHNYRLDFIVPGDSRKGYRLVWTGQADATCPCAAFISPVRIVESTLVLPVPTTHYDQMEYDAQIKRLADQTRNEEAAAVSPTLLPPETATPLTEATRHKLLVAVASFKAAYNVAIDPGDVDILSEEQAQQQLLLLRQQWQAQTAIAATDKL